MRRAKKRSYKKIAMFGVLILIFGAWFSLTAQIKINTENEVIQVGTHYEDIGIRAQLLGLDVSAIIIDSGEVDTNKVGDYKITYRPILSLKKFEKVVTVVDTEAPVIILKGDEEVYVEELDSYQELGFSATDNYDGDITNLVSQKISDNEDGSRVIEYSVQDSSGNEFSITRTIKLYVGKVYLTFDDGPSLNNTPKILDILKEKGVKATFFIVGFDDNKVNILQRQLEEGHTIGLHGMYHDYSMIYQSVNTAMGNFYSLEKNLFYATNGYTTKFIRFPGGSSNTVSRNYCRGVMTAATQRATEEGYTYFDWNVDSQDAGGTDTPEEIYQNVIEGLRPNRTNIVLMHDSGDKTDTVVALEWILDYCIENHYCLKAIDAETFPVQHNVSN